MIQIKVTPQKIDFDLSVTLPAEYVGKEVNMLFYIDEEVKTTSVSISPEKKPLTQSFNESETDTQKLEGPAQKDIKKTMADFWGVISDNTAKTLYSEVEQNRNGWDKNI